MTQTDDPISTLTVALSERSYPIHIGQNLVDSAGSLLAPILKQPRTFIVSDDNVAPLYLERVQSSLKAAGIQSDALVLPAGESTKNFSRLERIIETLLTAKIERSTTVIALGGGVVGDLTGFAASIVLRGISFVQFPTTLLAQVDSSVGGKTGINTAQGKNLVGSFHQPIAVFIDIETLKTLPERELRAGYGEICKYGLLGDEDFWSWLEEQGAAVLAREPAPTSHAIQTCCAAKASIVAVDERESGARALLNLGHTFAHALEAELGYSGALLHGEAVAMGIVMAFDLSARLGHCPAEDASRVRAHFNAVGIPSAPTHIASGLNVNVLLNHMAQDKKVEDGTNTFVLVRGIGKAFLAQDVPRADLTSVLEAALAV